MKEFLVALALAHGADLATTLDARARGAREGNPLLPQSTVPLILAKSGTATLEITLLHHFGKTHPAFARRFALVHFGVVSAFVGNNIRVSVTLAGK